MRCYRPLRRQSLKPRRNQINDPAYRRWIKSQPCLVSEQCWGPIDPHHVGHYGRGRDNDYNAVPLCRRHHDIAHDLKRLDFESRYGVSFEAAIAGLNQEWDLRNRRRIA